MFSVHRKQTPFVVVGSLKIYEKLHDLGWYGRRLCGGGGGVQMLISIETHITYDFPGGGGGGSGPPPPPLWIRTWGDCACAHAHFEPSLLANATSTRMSLVSRDACNEQMHTIQPAALMTGY